MQRQYVDISHFRAPYKNWPYLGMGDAAVAATMDSIAPANSSGVRVLTFAAALALTPILQTSSFATVTTTPQNQILLQPMPAGSTFTSALDWLNSQIAAGLSVVVSTNVPGGLQALVSNPALVTAAATGLAAGQLVLTAVGTKADEVSLAGTATQNALFGASQLPTSAASPSALVPGVVASTGLPPMAIAGIVIVGVGALVLAIGHLHRKATPNRRRARSNSGKKCIYIVYSVDYRDLQKPKITSSTKGTELLNDYYSFADAMHYAKLAGKRLNVVVTDSNGQNLWWKIAEAR